MNLEPFLGIWVLDPQECVYEHGDPPDKAVYEITADGRALIFAVEYEIGGMELEFRYRTLPNGIEQPYEDPNGIVDSITSTFTGAQEIETISRSGGDVLALAVRAISEDGLTMTVTQKGTAEGGRRFVNVSVYNKV